MKTRPLPEAVAARYPGLALRLNPEPQPFPGLRVGQVWVEAHGGDVAVFTLRDFYSAMIPFGEDRAPEPSFRSNDGTWRSEKKAIELLSVRGWLLADPACPHLAPWAPPEPA